MAPIHLGVTWIATAILHAGQQNLASLACLANFLALTQMMVLSSTLATHALSA